MITDPSFTPSTGVEAVPQGTLGQKPLLSNGSQPSKGERLVLRVESLGAGGMGIARQGGFVILIPRGTPGERVEVAVVEVKRRFATAVIVRVLENGPHSTVPRCSVFGACGGCDWQHVPLDRQREFKNEVAQDQLARIGGLTAPSDFTVQGGLQGLAYRNKLEFTVWGTGNGWQLGFHGIRESTLVPVVACPLAPPEFSRMAHEGLRSLKNLISQGNLPEGPAPLNRITVQSGLGLQGVRHALVLHVARQEGIAPLEAVRKRWLELMLSRFDTLKAVALATPRSGAKGREWLAPGVIRMWHGESFIPHRLAGQGFHAPVGGFFQVNSEVAGMMLQTVQEWLLPWLEGGPANARSVPVFDLFGGSGLFGTALARWGFPTITVDLDSAGLQAGRIIAKRRNLNNLTFEKHNLAQRGAYSRLYARYGQPRIVLADPPRKGLPTALVEEIIAAPPSVLVLVSCDGGTFARDAKLLAPTMKLTRLKGFDMFPQTHHLEMAAVFERIDPAKGA